MAVDLMWPIVGSDSNICFTYVGIFPNNKYMYYHHMCISNNCIVISIIIYVNILTFDALFTRVLSYE